MSESNMFDTARDRVLRAEHTARINRVIDHIETDLAGNLSVERLASVAAFSPYHFHRVFKSVVGENVSTFVRRRRVEKAASLLLADPAKPITRVAMECGFSSPAVFARVFRETYGMSASDWLRSGGRPLAGGRQLAGGSPQDDKNGTEDGKESQPARKTREVAGRPVRMLDPVSKRWFWRLAMESGEAKVEVRDIPEMQVAYLRHIGPYMGDSDLFGRLFQRLFSWAGPRGLVGPDTKVVSIYDDAPCVTDAERLRVDVAVSVPAGTSTDGDIGTRTVFGGTYAVGHFEILPHQYSEAWDLMGTWLSESGYQGDGRACLEMYLNNPGEDPAAKHVVEIYLPVKPA